MERSRRLCSPVFNDDKAKPPRQVEFDSWPKLKALGGMLNVVPPNSMDRVTFVSHGTIIYT